MRERFGQSWALAGFEWAIIVVLFFLFYFGPEAMGRNLSDLEIGMVSVGE
jgi:hypothetical protein